MYTKGPWFVSSSTIVCNKESRIIANCTPLHEIKELEIPLLESIENASLIAASPDMFEALKILFEPDKQLEKTPMGYFIFRLNESDVNNIKRAINKAEGLL